MASSNGPVPSNLTLLSHLPSHAQGEKVRFLGCVMRYDSQAGVLELQHLYPQSDVRVLALADVKVIANTLTRENVEVGAWVNVIGYVGETEANAYTRKGGGRKTKHETTRMKDDHVRVQVDVILLWNAGPLRVQEYEAAVIGRISANQAGS